VHIPAKVEYGIRALLTLTELGEATTTAALAESQDLPAKFLSAILNDLRRAGILISQRGADGGYRLARPAATVTLAEVMRALDGALAEVRGLRPEDTQYFGAATHLQDVWVAVRASMSNVLELVTPEDVVQGRFPQSVALPAAAFRANDTLCRVAQCWVRQGPHLSRGGRATLASTGRWCAMGGRRGDVDPSVVASMISGPVLHMAFAGRARHLDDGWIGGLVRCVPGGVLDDGANAFPWLPGGARHEPHAEVPD